MISSSNLPRILTLCGSILVALGAGTNYVYSAYGPQLGAKLAITHTQQNMIGVAGNMGVYLTAPVAGYVVDRKGPRILLAAAVFLLFTGYMGIRLFYDGVLTLSDHPKSFTPAFALLLLLGFFTGVGGNGALAAAMNASAKSFPDSSRATVNGLVVSGFGLSAFLFSTMAHTLFPGDISSFLLVLALGTAIPMVIGFFVVRPIPLTNDGATDNEAGSSRHLYQRLDTSDQNLEPIAEEGPTEPLLHQKDPDSPTHERRRSSSFLRLSQHLHSQDLRHASRASLELSQADFGSLSPTYAAETASDEEEETISGPPTKSFDEPDIHGRALLMNSDFWHLFSIVALLSGTGLMYINNVGAITQALLAQGNPHWDVKHGAEVQARQVSILSLANCFGRILIGITADYGRNKYGLPRTYFLCVTSIVMLASQLLATRLDDPSELWIISTLLGLSYGSMFSLAPVISLGWFGLAHFSQNWGFVSSSPVIAGNIFNIAFGRNLDAHTPSSAPSNTAHATSLIRALIRRGTVDVPDLSHQCLDGRTCYVDSFRVTVLACLTAFLLSVWASWKDRRRAIANGEWQPQGETAESAH